MSIQAVFHAFDWIRVFLQRRYDCLAEYCASINCVFCQSKGRESGVFITGGWDWLHIWLAVQDVFVLSFAFLCFKWRWTKTLIIQLHKRVLFPSVLLDQILPILPAKHIPCKTTSMVEMEFVIWRLRLLLRDLYEKGLQRLAQIMQDFVLKKGNFTARKAYKKLESWQPRELK